MMLARKPRDVDKLRELAWVQEHASLFVVQRRMKGKTGEWKTIAWTTTPICLTADLGRGTTRHRFEYRWWEEKRA